MTLAKDYNPRDMESRWYSYWEENGYFSPDAAAADAPPYCIMIPPPNVTGSLHMGHAFQDTIMDALIRYHRMKGCRTLWQPGMDHAGIATQMVVERLINAQGTNRHDYGRERFIEKVWQWKAQSGGVIAHQLRRMGASPDWTHERFTMDQGLSEAVNEVFIRLYDDGIIYRGQRLVNWDPVLHTALSDLEVLSEEEAGYLWHLRYPLVGEKGFVVVATTRPETMLGDSAVAVHPDDERYRERIGQSVHLPLTGRTIPIIADDHVDPSFGSGCLKITPAHDFNDYQVWQRHRHRDAFKAQPQGGLINVLTQSASIRENINHEAVNEGALIPQRYVGLDRFEARQRIVQDLKDRDLLEKTVEHRLMIPRGDRSNAVVEPYLTDQWYVDLTTEVQADGRPGGKACITDPAINAVREGRIRFVPENWSRTYFQWLENVEDWCISRQIWWGHRIPAWYDAEGRIYVAKDEAGVREKYALDAALVLHQDEDVLDTWFSSALWPFSTLGWPQRTDRLATFYPTSVLVTGFDIIFFWVARMIMMGTRFMEDVPFKEVYIHGLVRDAHGQKMSKSKGNVLDPIDLIDGIDLPSLVEKRTRGMMQPHLAAKIAQQTESDFPHGIPSFGTDALRFTFAALASNGRDINFDLGRTEGYCNFCNKIWNAAKFVLAQCAPQTDGHAIAVAPPSLADRWIVSLLQRLARNVAHHIHSYRFDLVARELYEFTWNHYCAWYLEICKPRLYGADIGEPAKAGTRRTLADVLETVMRLIHPLMPFISEEIWQQLAPHAGRKGETIMMQPYPRCDERKIDEQAESQMGWIMEVVQCIRKIKADRHLPPGKQVPVLIANLTPAQHLILEENRQTMAFLAKAQRIDAIEQTEVADSVMRLADQAKVFVPLAGLIDKAAERSRLGKDIAKRQAKREQLKTKLDNDRFVCNAPGHIVQRERDNLIRIESELTEMEGQLKRIDNR